MFSKFLIISTFFNKNILKRTLIPSNPHNSKSKDFRKYYTTKATSQNLIGTLNLSLFPLELNTDKNKLDGIVQCVIPLKEKQKNTLIDLLNGHNLIEETSNNFLSSFTKRKKYKHIIRLALSRSPILLNREIIYMSFLFPWL